MADPADFLTKFFYCLWCADCKRRQQHGQLNGRRGLCDCECALSLQLRPSEHVSLPCTKERDKFISFMQAYVVGVDKTSMSRQHNNHTDWFLADAWTEIVSYQLLLVLLNLADACD